MKTDEQTPIAIQVWQGKKASRTPLWLMRQAGRYLSEYRALRAKAGSFMDLCFTPEWAAEVTLQPMRRFDLDAAIVFSDILVIPHALGQTLRFVEGEGPKLDPLTDLNFLKPENAQTILAPIYETLRLVRAALPKDKALIGFAGSPWTVASYMIEGGGGHDFTAIKRFAAERTDDFQRLIDLLVATTIEYLNTQISAGAQAIQVFESWAGVLSGADFTRWVTLPNAAIIAGVKAVHPDVPLIAFPRGCAQDDLLAFVKASGANALGISQDVDPVWAANHLQPHVCVQGNLAPELLLQGGPAMDAKALEICGTLSNGPFMFNLGHGVIKETNPDNVAQLVDVVHGWRA